MARIKGNNSPNRLTGTNKSDEIYGYGANDEIQGLGGDDRIWGGEGGDSLYGGAGHDRLTGGLGDDVLEGGDGNDTLHGDAVGEGVTNWELELSGGVDWLYGGAGNDVLVGQYGGDHLWGGAGGDQFGYNQFSNSNEQAGIDRIYDFNPGEGDTIYLSNAADADPQISGRQNYQYLDTRAPGQENVGTLTPYDTNGDGIYDGTILRLYSDSDDVADLVIDLVGYVPSAENPTAGMSDFLFI